MQNNQNEMVTQFLTQFFILTLCRLMHFVQYKTKDDKKFIDQNTAISRTTEIVRRRGSIMKSNNQG